MQITGGKYSRGSFFAETFAQCELEIYYAKWRKNENCYRKLRLKAPFNFKCYALARLNSIEKILTPATAMNFSTFVVPIERISQTFAIIEQRSAY